MPCGGIKGVLARHRRTRMRPIGSMAADIDQRHLSSVDDQSESAYPSYPRMSVQGDGRNPESLADVVLKAGSPHQAGAARRPGVVRPPILTCAVARRASAFENGTEVVFTCLPHGPFFTEQAADRLFASRLTHAMPPDRDCLPHQHPARLPNRRPQVRRFGEARPTVQPRSASGEARLSLVANP